MRELFFGCGCWQLCASWSALVWGLLFTCREVDWNVIWADVGWIRDCFDHMRFDEHQASVCVSCFPASALSH